MKATVHPTYFPQAQVVCACGNTFTTGSTKQNITVEVCSKCHPLYTGEQRFLDVKGRVDTFQKKKEFAKQYKASHVGKKNKKDNKDDKQAKTLRELLGEN